jgi:2-keto-4-pentenoate hydratase/2-oxohepta-3-ene-1,7-dioic acid hydratase in catechol pathway
LVTPNEIDDPQSLRVRTWVSGQLLQDSNTDTMEHSIADVLSYVSRLMTLEAGDILLADVGPPAHALGKDQAADRYLKDGDIFEVEIDGVGRLRNFVRKIQDRESGA